MDHTENKIISSTSYFWNCLTLSEDCPFFSTTDPKLYYFGVGLAVLYVAFVLIILMDLKFYWSMDIFQGQLDNYINLVRKKVRYVQMDQRRLVSTQERTEKQLKRSQECKRVVTALRSALVEGNLNNLSDLTNVDNNQISVKRGDWGESQSFINL